MPIFYNMAYPNLLSPVLSDLMQTAHCHYATHPTCAPVVVLASQIILKPVYPKKDQSTGSKVSKYDQSIIVVQAYNIVAFSLLLMSSHEYSGHYHTYLIDIEIVKLKLY